MHRVIGASGPLSGLDFQLLRRGRCRATAAALVSLPSAAEKCYVEVVATVAPTN